MKRYLDLVPISAKIHGKQSRMSVFCIVLAVFLVTTIFGMADMFIRSQILQAQQESGNWHIVIKNISNEEAAIIAARPDIDVLSPYGVLNYRGDLGYTLGGKMWRYAEAMKIISPKSGMADLQKVFSRRHIMKY